MPKIPRSVLRLGLLAAVYLVVLVLINVGVIDDYLEATMMAIGINIILATSLNLITGFTGQFSLGHAGFMAIGAYSCALITLSFPTFWGFLVGVLAGALLAALVGFLVGLPTLRLRGDYLAIATLGLAEIVRVVLLNLEFTNGAAGLSGIPEFLDWTWLFVFTAGSVWLISNFIRSAPGRASISIREDEIAAESIGVRSTQTKVLAFTVGAFFGGVAGALYSSYFYFVKPDLFGFLRSIDILVIVVLGGLGSLSGSVIAAVVLAVINTLLQPFPSLRMVIYALVLVAIMLFRPQGLMGSREVSLAVFKRFLPGGKTPAVAEDLGRPPGATAAVVERDESGRRE